MKKIYLDYAAATPLDPEALEAMLPFLDSEFYNPSATYLAGRNVRRALEQARAEVAKVLGAKPAEVIFTAGATEANNLAIQGIMREFPGAEIITSAIDHESVLAPAGRFKHKIAPVNIQGIIDLDKLQKTITDKTVLVSVGLANNEIGTIQPLRKIANMLRQIREQRRQKRIMLPIYLHSDAAQAPCYLDVQVSRLGVDLMSINGGKLYGPKQTGALYVKAGVNLQPVILGGGQEAGLRSGTENVANYIGLSSAISKAHRMRRTEVERISNLRQLFNDGLAEIPSTKLNTPLKHASPHIINVQFEGVDNERLMMELDEVGVQVAVGSACSASSQEPSHVLRAIGLSVGQAHSSLRFSFGRQTSEKDIKYVLGLLQTRTV